MKVLGSVKRRRGTLRPSRIDRALLIAGMLLLIGALLSIFSHLDSAYAEIERGVFSTDPQTGFLLDGVQQDSRGNFFARVLDSHEDGRFESSGIGLLGVLLVAWAARRIGRRSGVPLGLIACSVLLPVALGLVAGLFSLWRFDALLDDLFEHLTGRSLPISGGCMPTLSVCSRVQALELVWTLAVAITCVLTAATFVLATRRAWVLGERGTTLPRRWAIGAMTLFGLGALSLVGSMPYAADHAREASECDDRRDWSIRNSTSTDLHGVMVESCGLDPWEGYRAAHGIDDTIHLAARVQVFADGWVSELPDGYPVEFFTPGELAASVWSEIERAHEFRDDMRQPPPADLELVVVLYIDERTPATAIREHLHAVRAAGITTLVLYGRAQVQGSLETVGSWTRRDLCPIATIRFDDDAPELSDFETWGEIIMRAIELDPEPLRLQP